MAYHITKNKQFLNLNFWLMTLYSMVGDYNSFVGTYCVHLEGRSSYRNYGQLDGSKCSSTKVNI
jgi:hypothetical protein